MKSAQKFKPAIRGVNDLATLRPDVARLWHPTKNSPLTPDDISFGSNLKVWWVGDACRHDFIATVSIMTGQKKQNQNTVCSVCKGRQILIGFNDFPSLFPGIFKEWHTTKNSSMSPYDLSSKSHKKVWWICSEGHEWEMSIAARTSSKRGCIYCNGRSILVGFNDLATTHPEMANEFHPLKNGKFTPQNVTSGTNKRVWWICKEGHEWNNILSSRVFQNHCCPVCSGQKYLLGYNDLVTTDPELASEWHPTKNGSLIPEQIRLGHNKKVWWICSLGHEFQASPNERTNSSANRTGKYSLCSTCHNRTILPGYNDLATIKPEVAKEWHPTKNNGLTAAMVSPSSGKKIWWLCDRGHEWEISVANRSNNGCPRCSLGNTSNSEQKLYDEMVKKYPDAVNSAKILVQWSKVKHAKVDILIPSLNTIIEYDGAYWHSKKTKVQLDLDKTKALLDAGYKVIRVRVLPLEFLKMNHENLTQVAANHGDDAKDLADKVIQQIERNRRTV